jgi:hypothetical protein
MTRYMGNGLTVFVYAPLCEWRMVRPEERSKTPQNALHEKGEADALALADRDSNEF